jgi:hypothetical protein
MKLIIDAWRVTSHLWRIGVLGFDELGAETLELAPERPLGLISSCTPLSHSLSPSNDGSAREVVMERWSWSIERESDELMGNMTLPQYLQSFRQHFRVNDRTVLYASDADAVA